MTTVIEGEIIHHQGTTCLVADPEPAGGKLFPFRFDAVSPEEKSWAYRLLPGELSEAQLTEWLNGERRSLRAEWEQQIGHVVGYVTIYRAPVARAGGGSGVQGHRVRYERGPDLEMRLTPPTPKTPEPPILRPLRTPESFQPNPAPKPSGLDGPDMF